MILALALLAACGDAAVDAPETSASSEKVLSTVDRLNALEAQTALLTKQVQAAQTKITALQAENRSQAATIEALAIDNAIHTSSIGVMNNQISALAVSQGYGSAIASETLDYVLKAAGGPGRQGGHLTVLDDYEAKLAEAGVTPVTGASVDELRDALFEVDPDTGANQLRVSGIGGRVGAVMNKVRGGIGSLRTVGVGPDDAMYVEWEKLLDGMTTDLVTNPLHSDDTPNSNPLFDVDSRVAAIEGGPGRGGAGASGAFTDYVFALAGSPTPADSASDAEIRAILFTGDEPRVDGSALATARRMRQRPEILFQEWDAAISEYLVALQNNPIYSDSASADYNPLFGLESRVDGFTHFVDDWQGETSALRATDDFLNGQVVYLKAIQATHTDYLLGLAGAKAPSPTPSAEELRLLMFNLGSPLVSDVAIEKPWVKNMEKKFPDTWSTLIKPEVSTLIADADKRREAGDLSVSAKASGEVKELADILKADYGKQIGDVQTDVDALWLDMVAGDEALQTEINELDAEVCALSEVVAGQWMGNDAMAAEAWLTLNGDGRFLACLAR